MAVNPFIFRGYLSEQNFRLTKINGFTVFLSVVPASGKGGAVCMMLFCTKILVVVFWCGEIKLNDALPISLQEHFHGVGEECLYVHCTKERMKLVQKKSSRLDTVLCPS